MEPDGKATTKADHMLWPLNYLSTVKVKVVDLKRVCSLMMQRRSPSVADEIGNDFDRASPWHQPSHASDTRGSSA